MKQDLENTHPGGMLIRLQGDMKHFSGLVALLIHQLVTDHQQTGKSSLDDSVKWGSGITIARLEAVGTADGQKALQTSQN